MHTVSHGTYGVAWGVVLGMLRGKMVRGGEREGWRAVLLAHISVVTSEELSATPTGGPKQILQCQWEDAG